MVDTFVAELPVYAHLPREQLDGEIADICRRNLAAFADHLRRDGPPSPALLDEVRASATRRADEGVPLDAVLAAYHIGARVLWDAIGDQAGDAVVAGRVLSFIASVSQVAAAAFVEERESITSDVRDARRALAEALLAGGPSDAVAERAGAPLAHAYAVLVLHLTPTPDELAAGVSTPVAGRRKLRRVEAALAPLGDGALHLLGPAGGTVLVPVAADGVVLDALVATASATVEAIGRSTGSTAVIGIACRPDRAELPAAHEEARAVLATVRRLGRPAGAYRVDDVLLELAVAGEVSVAEHLAALLDPLAGGHDLVATLEGWFAAGGNRRAAAAALFVHPNTLDYRLGRVAALTGLSPTSTRGAALLQAALVAARLQGAK
jgi:DNA-binding PucR family transcriptional regulator